MGRICWHKIKCILQAIVAVVGDKIVIGDDFHLTSNDRINPICRNNRSCFYLDHPHASITIGNHVGMSSPCIWIHDKQTIGNHVNIGGNCMILNTDVHQLDYMARRGNVNVNANVDGA